MQTSTNKRWSHLILNANLATMVEGGEPYGAIEHAALAISDQNIAWLGPVTDLPDAPEKCAPEVFSAGGRWLTPGLIDCHTHLIFAGSRASEFEQRLAGKTYQEIAAEGGGIMSTVRATRAADEDDLIEDASQRLRHWLAEGVTTIEIKSGYGLDLDSELRLLNAIRRLRERQAIDVRATCLAAHAVPDEFRDDPDGYVDLICEELLPEVKRRGLADAVDAYCEPLAFSADQVRRVFRTAAELGLPVKLHADQFSNSGGAALAAEFSALSADHLEFTDERGVAALAAAGTVAVLLPGAFHTLGETQQPPLRELREAAVPLAVATDCNPGTSPVSSLLTALNLACVRFGLSPEESLRGASLNAARALGIDARVGSLEVGKRADLALWDIEHPAELAYWVGGRLCRRVYKSGQLLY